MKVSLNTNYSNTRLQPKRQISTNSVQNLQSPSTASFRPMVITFGGNKLNQVAIVTAECNGIVSTGGVGTVAADFADNKIWDPKSNYKSITFMPLYNGQLEYVPDDIAAAIDPENHKFDVRFDNAKTLNSNGQYYFTAESLKGKSLGDIPDNKKLKLELLIEKDIEIGGATEKAQVFKVQGKDTYLFATDTTLRMPKPYQYGNNNFYASNSKVLSQADPYASFSKAVVDLMPDLEKHGINPRHMVLNDAQVAFIPEFVTQAKAKGSTFFDDISSNYIVHNAGRGYQQRIELSKMFESIASNEEINNLKNSDIYKSIQSLRNDKNKGLLMTRMYKEILSPIIGSDGETSALMLALKHVDEQNVGYANTVSPSYATSIALENGEAAGIKDILRNLYRKNLFFGILNGMDSPNMDSSKPIGLPFYNIKNSEWKEFAKTKEIDEDRFSNFETFKYDKDKNNLDEIIATKQRNAANLFDRINYAVDNKIPEVVIGTKRDNIDVTGKIDPKFIDMIKGTNDQQKQHVNVFVTWGRADEQKGLDVTINSFYKFMKQTQEQINATNAKIEQLENQLKEKPALQDLKDQLKTAKDKLTELKKADNSVLIMGGPIKDTYLEKDIQKLVKDMADDPVTKGKFTFMSGFAPNAVLSSVADAPIFPSRFAPCELTDLEAMRFGATPIVSGLEGLADKNFDVRTDKARATGYKTFYTAVTDIAGVKEDKVTDAGKKAIKEYWDIVNKFKKDTADAKLAVRMKQTGNNPNSYSEEQIKEFVGKAVKDAYADPGSKLRKALMKVRDVLVEEDIVKALTHYTSLDETTKKSMMKHAFELQTGWRQNAALQAKLTLGNFVEKQASAGEFYQEMVEENKKPTLKRLFDFTKEGFAKIKTQLESLVTKAQQDGAKLLQNKPVDMAEQNVQKPDPGNVDNTGGKNKAGKPDPLNGKPAGSVADDLADKASEVTKNTTPPPNKSFFNKTTIIAFLGVAALAGLGYYLFKPENKPQKNKVTNKTLNNKTYMF